MTNTPPNAVDMEAYLLGCLLYKNQYLPDDLTIADFFEPKHQDIARMLWALKEKQNQAR
jgi:replicative DNA helicase